MKKYLFLLSLLVVSGLSFAEMSEYEKYKQNRAEMFQAYKTEIERRFENYKNNIEEEWTEIEIPDNYRWVEYSDDYKERTIVDYKEENVKIQVTVPKDESDEESKKKLLKNMEKMMSNYVRESSKKNPYIEEGKVINSKETIISDIYGVDAKNKNQVKKVAEKVVNSEKIEISPAKNKNEKVVEIVVPFPKDGILAKAQKYRETVNKRASEYKLKESLVFAVIHCESSYNPMARSPVPAYGLMQIVPTSAGKDISKRLYGKERIFTPEYLYNGENNIEAGTNYLNLLYYSYLKDIKDSKSREYCTIAAYNTGSGNVAKAFVGTTSISKAVEKINSMSSKEVYNKLIKDLPYDETKGYLKKVTEKEAFYSQKLEELK